MVPQGDKGQMPFMKGILRHIMTLTSVDTLVGLFKFLQDHVLQSKTLFRSTKADMIDVFAPVILAISWRKHLFTTDVLRKSGHLVQMVELFHCHSLESRLPFSGVQSQFAPDLIIGPNEAWVFSLYEVWRMSTRSWAVERLSLTATGWKMGSQHYSNVLAVRRTYS